MSDTQRTGRCKWQSPSNIALVKYWGKKGFQIPSNASISFTLDACHTQTQLEWSTTGQREIRVFVDGVENEPFKPKIEAFFNHISQRYPILDELAFTIHTHNTFPHSSGIASSASGMSALALCVCTMLQEMGELNAPFLQEASVLARIGSGSASRSVYGGLAEWGIHTDFPDSSDQYAVPFTDAHEVFHTYQDTILLVHEGQKSVSSTVGHSLLDNHIFGKIRFEAANNNLSEMKKVLMSGDLDTFIKIVEDEALMLHALMMTSSPSFILMQPDTLAIIQKVRAFRKQNNVSVAFTLDAGANVHLLYPKAESDRVLTFIKSDLVGHCANGKYICDSVGHGPTQLEC